MNDDNWTTDIDMVEGETQGILEAQITYRKTNEFADEFKLRLNHAWAMSAGLKEGVAYVGDANWDTHLTTSNNNIKLAEAGVYTLTFNPTDWVFTATKTADLE